VRLGPGRRDEIFAGFCLLLLAAVGVLGIGMVAVNAPTYGECRGRGHPRLKCLFHP
jgi:hypothetical protein